MHHPAEFARSRASRPTPGDLARASAFAERTPASAPSGGWGGREDRFRASLHTPLRGAEFLILPIAAAYGLHQAVLAVARTVLGGAEFEGFAHSFFRFVVSWLLCSVVASACVLIAGVLRSRRRARTDQIETAAAKRGASAWPASMIRVIPHVSLRPALLPVPLPLGSADPILRPIC